MGMVIKADEVKAIDLPEVFACGDARGEECDVGGRHVVVKGALGVGVLRQPFG